MFPFVAGAPVPAAYQCAAGTLASKESFLLDTVKVSLIWEFPKLRGPNLDPK